MVSISISLTFASHLLGHSLLKDKYNITFPIDKFNHYFPLHVDNFPKFRTLQILPEWYNPDWLAARPASRLQVEIHDKKGRKPRSLEFASQLLVMGPGCTALCWYKKWLFSAIGVWSFAHRAPGAQGPGPESLARCGVWGVWSLGV